MAAGDLLTTDGQIEWRGLLLGAASPFRWRSLEGWLDLSMSTSDTPRTSHGEYPGRVRAESRTITYRFVSKGVHLPQFPAAIEELRAATTPTEDGDEEPLVVRLHGRRHMVLARCLRRTIPTDGSYAAGVVTGALQWKATDPRVLELPQREVQIGLPSAIAEGVQFPLSAPIDLGPGAIGGTLSVVNAGSAAAWPLWRITGPVTGLVLEHLGLNRALRFAADWTLGAGQSLEIDTKQRTVRLAAAGVSRQNELVGRGWFPLLPGENRIAFRASGYHPNAVARAVYHHTSM